MLETPRQLKERWSRQRRVLINPRLRLGRQHIFINCRHLSRETQRVHIFQGTKCGVVFNRWVSVQDFNRKD